MAFLKSSVVFCSILSFLSLNCRCSHVSAKVYMVVMEDDSVISYKASRKHIMRGEEAQKYKAAATTKHDIFLDSFLPTGSYKKLYSYTHLLNGFAIHAESEEEIRILRCAKGVRLVQEDIKMAKMTTYTPNFIGASGVWPLLGGAENSGDGVVIGMIDTGIDPKNPSFVTSQAKPPPANFKGICRTGNRFPPGSCNGKIVAAMWFARAGQATGEFNATIHYASPYDPDGHGSHTASTAAGNFHTPVISRGYNFGHASGMAPGARLAIYKAAYPFGGYMSDVIAAVDQAVEDGVNIISLSMAPDSVPSGPPASFFNLLETQLLLATKAGVLVVQAAGNGGPEINSVVSFSPWILSVAASTTDRKYRKSVITGNGQVFSCGALSPQTPGETMYPLAWAEDVSIENSTYGSADCQDPNVFIKSLVQGKVIICTFQSEYYEGEGHVGIIDTIQKIGAAGVIVTDRSSGDVDIDFMPIFLTPLPSAVVLRTADFQALMSYYYNNTVRDEDGKVVSFGATVQILDGRRATYTGEAPVVADYSSRGPDVENAALQPAEALKPNVMAPGHNIWGAWSPTSRAVPDLQGDNYALLSGTSMATPHVAGVAALIKQRHPTWSPAMIMSAIMTTADVADRSGRPLMARRDAHFAEPATPFDMGAGAINAGHALDPGLVFDAGFRDYLQFLCAVPGVDDAAVLRAVGSPCPPLPRPGPQWCSDLNSPSVTVSSLVGSRRVDRRVTSVGAQNETYVAYVRVPAGVSVRVSPAQFSIAPGATRAIRIVLSTTKPGNGFSFGEVVLKGDKKHTVRIPLAVYPISTLHP